VSTKLTVHIALIANVFLAGCSLSVQIGFPTATPQPIITATLPLPLTPRPSETPLPPLPTPTIAPVTGTTSTQLNVRAEPSTVGDVLGNLTANVTVQIVGQDPGGNWWQILYEAGVDGKGWVTAQYVLTTTRPEVPVIGGGGTEPGSGISSVVIQQLNVRSGPGTNFNSLGILNADDVVLLTGRNRDGTWFQIEFAGGPEGRGWVSAGFIRTEDAEALPIISEAGEVVGTGTLVDTPPPPTPTVIPASLDSDSTNHPIETILFERAGTRTLIYNGDVSTPQGDVEDWIAFIPYDNVVFVSIRCTGNGSLRAEVLGSGVSLACDEAEKAIPVQAETVNLLHVEAIPNSGPLQYVNYILTVKASQ
jgi:uncharacterized protein YraI